jgi:hypothetical protein
MAEPDIGEKVRLCKPRSTPAAARGAGGRPQRLADPEHQLRRTRRDPPSEYRNDGRRRLAAIRIRSIGARESKGGHMSETKREYAAHYPQAAAAHPLQEGPVRQPARLAPRKTCRRCWSPRSASRIRHDRRRASQDHEARGGDHSAGQRIRRRQFARDQDADRHDEGYRKKDRGRTAAGAAPVRPPSVPRGSYEPTPPKRKAQNVSS